MECVCGCGREISGKLGQRNFIAASVALELLAWDKNRASRTPGPDGREGLIARGTECYERLLYSLHEEGNGDPDADCEEWLRESEELRLQRSDMTKKRFLGVGPSSPSLSAHDMAQLDRRHPELSFTGQIGMADTDRPPPAGTADDLVDRLERLRKLHTEGVLTDDEFAVAKARLLGRD